MYVYVYRLVSSVGLEGLSRKTVKSLVVLDFVGDIYIYIYFCIFLFPQQFSAFHLYSKSLFYVESVIIQLLKQSQFYVKLLYAALKCYPFSWGSF